MAADSPYPELKKSHTMAHTGRPWRDVKPPPSGPVWAVIQGVGSYWTLVASVELGVFDAIERLGPTPVEPLAAELDVSAPHLQHLCDALVGFGFLDQVDDVYELTETAERYLCTDGPASMAALVRVAPGPIANWEGLADTIRTGEVATPIELDPASFYGPLVTATFATQLRAAGRLGLRLGWARRPGLRVLDLGAGCAPWAIAVLDQSPGSTAVVNDLPGVVELAVQSAGARGLSERVEVRPGDFFEIDLEPSSFDVVVLGHVCRTEGDERARRLVRRAFEALRPGGQVIIADYFTDDHRRQAFGVQMGLTMLANTRRGRMVTHSQAVGWMRDAGFAHVRLLEPIGFNFVYTATRPEVSDEQ
ncbi:MAG: methyltransferase domain-containing protein [Actinobacteria bacterium]|nr:methyltransferase domain-containing protein [Actinomycetota bacterium]